MTFACQYSTVIFHGWIPRRKQRGFSHSFDKPINSKNGNMIVNAYFWAAALVCIVLDQISKYLVMASMTYSETVPLWADVFHFTFVTNSGAAFSLFSESGDWLKWVSLLVSIMLAALGWFSKDLTRWEQVGYGCILGGAVGNGIDRFIYGHVVDFLDVRLIDFPVFNIADMSINIGLVCIAIAFIRTGRHQIGNKS